MAKGKSVNSDNLQFSVSHELSFKQCRTMLTVPKRNRTARHFKFIAISVLKCRAMRAWLPSICFHQPTGFLTRLAL